MNNTLKTVVLGVALIVASSLAAWSQPKRASNHQSQSVSVVRHESSNSEKQSSSELVAYDSIAVVGHLALPGAVISNIRNTEDLSRSLVEATDQASQTLNLIDVADPSQPKIVDRIHKPAELKNSRLELEVGDAALFADMQNTSSEAVPRSVTLVSLADPSHPSTVRRFDKVTSVNIDHQRGFIYLAAADGLWILQPVSAADRVHQQQQFEEMFRSAMTP